MRSRSVACVVGLCAAVLLSACGGGAKPATSEKELTKVQLLIDFLPNGNHAIFHAAKHLGFFKEEGLDVEIRHVLGATDVVKSVAAGQVQFGYADFATMAVARDRGQALTAVFGIQQQTPMAILSKASAGIKQPSDLVGKKIVDSAGSSTQIVWPIFLEANRLSAKDLKLQLVDPGSRLPLVVEGRADASMGFYPDNAPALAAQCKCEVNVLRWRDFGIEALSNGIFVAPSYIKEAPDTIAAFTRALARSLALAETDPAKVATALKAAVADVKVPVEIVTETVTESAKIARTKATANEPLGTMAEQDWRNTLDLMLKTGSIASVPAALDDYYTNKFVPTKKK